jgi:putative ABC transport system permease protein
VVTPPYFRTLKVNILRGRDFDSSDREQSEPVAIVNEAFVQRTLKTRDPFTSAVRVGDDDLPRRIVGVAANVKSFVGFPCDPTIFIPASQAKFGLILAFDVWFPTHVLVRTSGDPSLFTNTVEAAIRETDASIPVGHVLTMDQIFARSLATQRFMMVVVTVFAALAMALAAIGIYGVIAFSVSQRSHELGIRMALGADRTNVLALVLREGAHLALAGAFVGLVGTLALHKVMNSVLFGIRPGDWRTMAAASFCLLCVAFLACYIPARRATKVDPNVALRCE